jgi:hypothetical protein
VATVSNQQPRVPAPAIQDPYAGDRYGQGPPGPELPPLRALQQSVPPAGGPESMTGVQYEQPRVNGYR